MNAIAAWLVETILSWLLKEAVAAVSNYAAKVEADKKEGQINDANTKAYEAAISRKDRIDAALSLLNRTAP